MAKVLTDENGDTHLRGSDDSIALCGDVFPNSGAADGTLICSKCAAIALRAVELVTKAEKREWRKL